jgi:hypothetical protein
MPNEVTAPSVNVEIVSAPSVKDMTISQVGQNMFTINMNIIAVVRFVSSDVAQTAPVVLTVEALKYADGTTPPAGGESAAFNDFTKQNGYPPQSREILAEWVKLQQGGA